jgi:hypothetical protein
MNAIEELVRTSLRERAGAEVDAVALVDASTRRGRALVRRHRLTRGLAAMAVVAVVAGLTAVATRAWPYFDLPFQLAPGTAADTRLPRLPGVPGARHLPARVGTDPTVLHFDAPALVAGSPHHTWSSGAGYEQLETANGYVTIGRDMAVLDLVPRQGGPGYVMREEPADGLWLRIETFSLAAAREMAAAVNLNQSQRCVLPFSVGALPVGVEVVECYVGFIDGRYVHGGLVLRDADDRTMEVQAQYEPRLPGSKTANHRVGGGRDAFLYPGRDEVELLGLPPGLHLSARIGTGYRGFEVADADLVLAGVTVATDVEDMATWPESVVAP